MDALQRREIQTRPIWELMHRLKPYAAYPAYKIEKALRFHDRVVNLPCSTSLTFEEVDRVSAAVRELEA